MRRLDADESVAWGRVMATVRPLRAVATPAKTSPRPAAPLRHPAVMSGKPTPPVAKPAASFTDYEALFARSSRQERAMADAAPGGATSGRQVTIVVAPAPRAAPNTLDGSWDRKLGRGIVMPDSSIDLHGHTLASAHALLDQGLDRAIRRGDRVLLLVTGKPPRPESERPHARGAIRAAVADWLASSRHCDAIAAVRGAHPRHGGQGALYIILRRQRG